MERENLYKEDLCKLVKFEYRIYIRAVALHKGQIFFSLTITQQKRMTTFFKHTCYIFKSQPSMKVYFYNPRTRRLS